MIAIVLALSATLPGAAHDGHGATRAAGEQIADHHDHACDAESVCDKSSAVVSDCTLLVGHCASALAPDAGHDIAEMTPSRMNIRPVRPQNVTGLIHTAEPPPPRS